MKRYAFLLLVCSGVLVASLTISRGTAQAFPGPQSPAAAAQQSKADDEWLAHTRSLYTSTEHDGLKGFVCTVRPDWHTLVSSANNGAVDSTSERKIAVLSTVRITLLARTDGTSNIDWDAGDPPADLTEMMNSVRDGTKQTLTGFVQFWSVFADVSVIPSNSQGVLITRTAEGGHVLQGNDSGTAVTETFDASDVLREYDVTMPGGATVLFTPTFSPTPTGLRVTYFLAHLRQNASSPDQEMHVGIIYTDVGGFTIPSRLNMSVVGTGTFNFDLEGCRVNP
jgi:hypothetical protein